MERQSLSGRLSHAPAETADDHPCATMAALIRAETGHGVASCRSQALRLSPRRGAALLVYDLFVIMDESWLDAGGEHTLFDPWLPSTTDEQERDVCGRFRIATYRRGETAIRILSDSLSERVC
jgi:hypothetical protein